MNVHRQMDRLCFGWHRSEARFDFLPGIPGASGLPRSNDPAFGALAGLHPRSGNRGYLVVGEAAMRLFECDYARSASVDLPQLVHSEDPIALAQAFNARFDALILPMAYEIAPDRSYERLAAFFETLTVPVITLGLGIEGEPDDPVERLHPSVRVLLRLLNDRAVLFGVRAETTQRWLNKHGYEQAVAIGCPSLHLYPAAIDSLRGRAAPVEGPIVTGGYLFRDADRARWQCAFFQGEDATYILQDEIFCDSAFEPDTAVIDDATGAVSSALVAAAARRWAGLAPPFARYAFFHNLDAWRLCCAGHQLYVGDRFHGAVVALQTGRPVLLFAKDVRTRELSVFYGIPTVDLEHVSDQPLRDVVAESLTRTRMDAFVDTWRDRHDAFLQALRQVGLHPSAGARLAQRNARRH